jgi:hypothetical protein
MRRNTANQSISFQAVSKNDGSEINAGSPVVYVQIDGGAQATGVGVVAADGNGSWSYYPTQAETDGNHLRFTFTLTNAVTTTVNVYTLAALGVGNGQNTVTVTVSSSEGAVPSVGITILSGGLAVAYGVTSSSGVIEFRLDDGNYEAAVQSRLGYEAMSPVSFAVAGGPELVSVVLASQSITPPPMPGLCTVRAVVINELGPVVGVSVSAHLVGGNNTVSSALVAQSRTSAVTDSAGAADLLLIQGGQFTRGGDYLISAVSKSGEVIYSRTVRIPDQETVMLEEIE